jgi:hypothetical protein
MDDSGPRVSPVRSAVIPAKAGIQNPLSGLAILAGLLILLGAGCVETKTVPPAHIPPASTSSVTQKPVPVASAPTEATAPRAFSGCFRGSSEESWISSSIRAALRGIFPPDADLKWIDEEMIRKLQPGWAVSEMCHTGLETSDGPSIAVSLVHWQKTETSTSTKSALILPKNAKSGTENILGLFRPSVGVPRVIWSSPVQLNGIVDTGTLYGMAFYENAAGDQVIQSHSGGGETGFNWEATIDWQANKNAWNVVSYHEGQ